MKHLTVFFTCVFALAVGFAAEDDLSMEDFFPIETPVFLKTEPIADFIVSVKSAISLLDKQSSADITGRINSFKNATGIDPLDEKSLNNTGLDIKRRVAFAYLQSDEPCLLLPVLNGETFGRVFTEIMLKMNDDPKKKDLYPAVTSYRNFRVSQYGKDIFTAAVNGFFIVAYSGEQIRSIIDMSFQNKSSALSQDPVYLSYLKKRNNGIKTVHAFVRGPYLQKGSYFESGQGVAPFIDFFSLGVSVEKSKSLLHLGVSFDKNSLIVKSLFDLFSTELTNLALYDSDSLIYTFLALNLNSFEALPDKELFYKARELYRMFCSRVEATYGVDVKEDFSMYSKGVFNIMVGDIIKNEYVVFMPMTDASKSLALSRKIQAHLKKKYEPKNLFGYENVGSFGRAAYYFSEDGVKHYVYSDQRGFYIATSISLLNAAAKKPYITAAGKPFVMKVNNNMWAFSVIKRDALWPLSSSKMSGLNSFTGRLGDIYVSCSRNDSFVSLDAETSIEK